MCPGFSCPPCPPPPPPHHDRSHASSSLSNKFLFPAQVSTLARLCLQNKSDTEMPDFPVSTSSSYSFIFCCLIVGGCDGFLSCFKGFFNWGGVWYRWFSECWVRKKWPYPSSCHIDAVRSRIKVEQEKLIYPKRNGILQSALILLEGGGGGGGAESLCFLYFTFVYNIWCDSEPWLFCLLINTRSDFF